MTASFTLFFLMFAFQEQPAPIRITVHPMTSFAQLTEKGELDGIVVRRLKEACCRAGLDLRLQLQPWSRAFRELKNAKTDALAGVLRNPAREKLFYFTKHHVLRPRNVLVVRKGYNKLTGTPKDLSELSEYSIDYVRGYSLMERLDSIKGKYIPAEGQSISPIQGFKKLIKGRIDILIIDENVLGALLIKLKARDKVTILKPHVQEKPSFIAFPKALNSGGTIDCIDRALESMVKDGSYERIAYEYLNNIQTQFECPKTPCR